MKKFIYIIMIAAISNGCEQACPPVLSNRFEGDGFLFSQEPFKFPIIFVPVCQMDKSHYLKSLHKSNLGDGISFGIYNRDYKLAIANPSQRFKLLQHSYKYSPLDSLYVIPVHLKYQLLHRNSPVVTYPIDFQLEDYTIKKFYDPVSIQIDTIIFLPHPK